MKQSRRSRLSRHGDFRWKFRELLNDKSNHRNGKMTEISRIITKTYDEAKGTIRNWAKASFTNIKAAIRTNKQIQIEEERVDSAIWKKQWYSSRNYKRVDLNFLIAHNRLPLARFLTKIKVTTDATCRLCKKQDETQRHIFLECSLIAGLKMQLKNDLTKIPGGKFDLTYELLRTHSPKWNTETNEYVSIYKQTIWQVRGEIYYNGVTEVERRILELYISKCNGLKITGRSRDSIYQC